MTSTQPIAGVWPNTPTEPQFSPSGTADVGAMAPPSTPPPPAPPVRGSGAADAGVVPDRPGLRDRVLGIRAVAAVALASLIVGGLGGAALGALSDGADTDQRGPGGGQFVPGQQGQVPGGQQGQLPGGQQGQLPGGGGQFQGQLPGGQQGQLPPGTLPQDDDVPGAIDGDGDGTTT
ncbi:hypothetical protein BH09ACT12_BH09ACT12_35070 [soil metagenome]